MRHLFRQLFSHSSRPSVMKPLIAVVGATGTGKSKLAVDLASRFNGEIINGDAMQMYRGLPIITNQIPLEERNGVPHHLLSCVELKEEPWWIGRFKQECLRLIDEIHAKGKLPILVGGTHYYTQAVLFNDQLLDSEQFLSDDDSAIRHDSSDRDSSTTWPILDAAPEVVLQKLKEVDPVMADRWHPNEARKIRRSLEIYLQTGRPASEVYAEQERLKQADIMRDGLSLGVGQLRYSTMIFWMHSEKAVLNCRLEKRVDLMLEQGLMDEALCMSNFLQEQKAQGDLVDHTRGIWISIGYKELAPYFDALHKSSMSDLELESLKSTCIESIKSATRQYAVSQIKWIRNKLWRALVDAGATNRLYLLDSTNVETWKETITKPSELLVRALLDDDSTPDPKSLSELARTVLSAKEAQPRRDSNTSMKCMTCNVCNKTMQGSEQWEIHIHGNAHKRALKSAAKKVAREKYFRERHDDLRVGNQPRTSEPETVSEEDAV
ncbi:tRNA dimethylallyltransferase [Aspergillus saccharolyticus JOP 1030-1]|uniref:tRNA dimethylallyltransferase n=1 Tax=Aspergillus saccharolyticus JOP 1030-1 TaxID=1450539 RepID=A0A318ZV85_9EURO|nr:tRNA isopentenyltransferase [Aspergillus saccharolyticus JOP 1030-1]PYH48283.1 tRNA isopentenyltransferase [Aspergillus saccharolyticus JOP 1030-1]